MLRKTAESLDLARNPEIDSLMVQPIALSLHRIGYATAVK
jgi:hypothetical protein